jgi:hypothetical protein
MPAQRDRRALRILTDTFWSSAGWKSSPYSTPPADLAYAIQAGYMFPPENVANTTHDAIVARVLRAVEATSLRAVADAFLASLSTRRVEWRSALSSYLYARHIQPHQEDRSDSPGARCSGCRHLGYVRDRNSLNFERYRWGGVSLDEIYYALFDLEQLRLQEIPEPTPEDRVILSQLLYTAQNLPSTNRPKDLAQALRTVLPSNADQREILLKILGLAGVLTAPGHPGYWDHWLLPDEREMAWTDWGYPMTWWRGGGVNWGVAMILFPGLYGVGGGRQLPPP